MRILCGFYFLKGYYFFAKKFFIQIAEEKPNLKRKNTDSTKKEAKLKRLNCKFRTFIMNILAEKTFEIRNEFFFYLK